jgi:ATP-dependent RNA helicase DeaD
MQKFSEMTLAPELKLALQDLKFIEPTDVQAKVIPSALKGKDLISCAQTGSGKTAAYAIPIIEQLITDTKKRALIVAPTRELAQQIADVLRLLARHTHLIQVTTLVGGVDMRKQLKSLKRNPRIIVGTPGRITDHLKRRSLNLGTTEILVIDEGDRMLDMGFAPQLDEILKFLPKKRQSSLFTATIPPKVRKLANKYLFKPESINIGRVSMPVKTVKQSVVQVKVSDKNDRILDELNARQGSIIVFARTKYRTSSLTKNLKSYGYKVDQIHGGRTQGQRNKAIQNFKLGKSRILCATDVAARGIDVPHVEHVINFDLPMMKEDYVHRIGRTARNGAKGEAVSFVTPEDHGAWIQLANEYKIQGVKLEGVSKKAIKKKQGKKSRGKRKRQRNKRGRKSTHRNSASR